MAYKQTVTKEHSFKTFGKDMKEETVSNLMILFGKEQYLVNWALNEIVNKYVNKACVELDFTKLDGEKVDLNTIIETCETLSMFSEKRVVCIEKFTLLSGDKSKAFGSEEEKELIKYLGNPPENTIIIFLSEEVDRRKKIFKTIAEYGSAYEFTPLDEKLLKAFVEKRFKSAGKIIRTSLLTEMIETTGYFHKETGYTLYNMENDIKKIIATSSDTDISPSDVALNIAGNIESNIFAMIDAVSNGRKDEAYRLLYNLLTSGQNIYMILSMLVSQFELILEVKELRDDGKSLNQIKDILGVHEFRIRKAMGYTEKYGRNKLKYILKKAYEVDRNIKTGLLNQQLAIEMFIAEI